MAFRKPKKPKNPVIKWLHSENCSLEDGPRVLSPRNWGLSGKCRFKVDDTNRPDFEAAGTGPFIPFEDKPYPMSYWEVPADVLEDQNELCGWARKAWEASRRSGSKKGRRRK